jgi:membrane fusion protein, multidrug efflux system
MVDTILKFRAEPESKTGAGKRSLMRMLRDRLRLILLLVIPLLALIAGLTFYLASGRYISTDNADVGAQKVLITPDISGKIEKVVVQEGQPVRQGDVLFEIDPIPFRLAEQQAKATLDQAHTTYDNLKANLKIYDKMADLMQQGVDLKQRDVDRKSARSSTSTIPRPRWSPRGRNWPSSSSRCPARKPSCSAMPICRSRIFRPMCWPRRPSARPSATSITP